MAISMYFPLSVAGSTLRMAGVCLAPFLLLLPHLVPAKFFLLETEAKNKETGKIEDNIPGGQDYSEINCGRLTWEDCEQTKQSSNKE